MTIRVENLTKSYGDTAVLKELSLTLPCPGNYALLGPSGCGKTTLLRLLCGLEKPNCGQISFDGTPVFSYAFQEARLFPQYTLRQNIELLSPERDVTEILRTLDLHAAENQYPRELSGGMLIRAGLARALSKVADIYLLDEITAGQDPLHAGMVTDAICRYTAGTTRITVSHDADAVLRVADTAVFLQTDAQPTVYSLSECTRETLLSRIGKFTK